MFIGIGIVLSISNFLPNLLAPGIYGTTTEISGEYEWAWYIQKYGNDGLNDRHMGGMEFCVDDPSTCVIVM
jgi:hypothetical protein